MSSKTKDLIFSVLTAILAFGLCIASWAFGLFSDFDGVDFVAVMIAVGCIVGLFFVCNIFCALFLARRLKQRSDNRISRYASGVIGNAQSLVRRVKRITVTVVVLSYVYLFALLFLICLFCFASGRSGLVDDETIFIILFPSYLAWGITDTLFINTPTDEPPQPGAELPRDRFPLIYQTAMQAARAVGYKKPILLFLTNGDTSAVEYRGRMYIALGYLQTAIYTSAELYTALACELTHFVRSDVRNAQTIERIVWRWDESSSNPISAFSKMTMLSFPAKIMSYYLSLYLSLSDLDRERAADAAVKPVVDARTFADTVAKREMLDKYTAMPVPELDYYFFEKEAIPQDEATRDYSTYIEYYKRYGDMWKNDIARELQPHVGMRTIARQRMANMGCTEYDANATERDDLYVVEQQRVLSDADKLSEQSMTYSYFEMRKLNYSDRKASIAALDEAEANGKKLVGSARNMALVALVGLDDDRALRLADEMIADNDYADYARFSKGIVLARRRDDECINCFKSAQKNSVLTEDAYIRIINYARIIGNSEVFDEYSKEYINAANAAEKKNKDKLFNKSTVTVPCDLDEGTVLRIADTLASASGNTIKAFYISKYVTTDGCEYYPLAFEVNNFAAFTAAVRDAQDVVAAVAEALVEIRFGKNVFCCNSSLGLIRKIKKADGAIVFKYGDANKKQSDPLEQQ